MGNICNILYIWWNPLDDDLIEACTKNDLENVEKCIKIGVNINAIDIIGYTGLMWACLYKNIEIIKILIENNANINYVNTEDGDTALTIACRLYNANCVNNDVTQLIIKYLVEHGANVNYVSRYSHFTPLSISVRKYNIQIIKYLFEHGALIDIYTYKSMCTYVTYETYIFIFKYILLGYTYEYDKLEYDIINNTKEYLEINYNISQDDKANILNNYVSKLKNKNKITVTTI